LGERIHFRNRLVKTDFGSTFGDVGQGLGQSIGRPLEILGGGYGFVDAFNECGCVEFNAEDLVGHTEFSSNLTEFFGFLLVFQYEKVQFVVKRADGILEQPVTIGQRSARHRAGE
jgi:hypothetical protein